MDELINNIKQKLSTDNLVEMMRDAIENNHIKEEDVRRTLEKIDTDNLIDVSELAAKLQNISDEAQSGKSAAREAAAKEIITLEGAAREESTKKVAEIEVAPKEVITKDVTNNANKTSIFNVLSKGSNKLLAEEEKKPEEKDYILDNIPGFLD